MTSNEVGRLTHLGAHKGQTGKVEDAIATCIAIVCKFCAGRTLKVRILVNFEGLLRRDARAATMRRADITEIKVNNTFHLIGSLNRHLHAPINGRTGYVALGEVLPVKKHVAAKRAKPAPVTSGNILSFYRHHAQRCESAARNAPNEKMRAELCKMAHVWREFAAEHERTAREGSDLSVHVERP